LVTCEQKTLFDSDTILWTKITLTKKSSLGEGLEQRDPTLAELTTSELLEKADGQLREIGFQQLGLPKEPK
jgi:hypothetical protein